MLAFSPLITRSFPDLSERREVLNNIMRESALQARDIIFLESPNCEFSQLTRLASVSRACWFQDLKLANILFDNSDLGREHLEIRGNAISLNNPLLFEQQLLEAKSNHFLKDKNHIIQVGQADPDDSPGHSKRATKRSGKLAALNRQSSLWTHKNPRLALAGVIVTEQMLNEANIGTTLEAGSTPGEFLVTNPDHMMHIIGKDWEPTFTEKPIDEDAASVLLDEYESLKTWDWSASKPPTADNVDYYLSHLGNCEPGTDGVPPPAWKHSGPAGRDYITDLTDAALSGKPLPKKAQEGLFVFAPKGDATAEENMTHSAFRKPKDLRPITLQNEDRKTVAGILNWCILPTVILFCSILQRGFIPGRQLVQNVVDLDFHSRCNASAFYGKTGVSYQACISDCLRWCLKYLPLTVLFDFAAAFPSVAHKWIRSVLKKIRIPQGMLNAFNVLYQDNEGVAKVGNLLKWLFSVKCGVLQGCPLSGTLFVIAIDPLLTLFEHYIYNPGLGAVYACADDIGAALKDIRGLIICARLFEKFRLASGLTLKPTKCVAILVSLDASEVNLRAIRDKLIQHIPQWKNLRFAPLGKYLGIHIGPKLGGINWEAPMAKTFSRVEEILATKPPLVLACSTYNSRALSVLGYVAQLTPPPECFKVSELRMANKVLRLATNSFDTDCVHQLEVLGGPRLPRPLAYVIACITRASIKTFDGFELQHSSLVDAVFKNESLAQSSHFNAIPEGWDSPAYASNLSLACSGRLADTYFPGALNTILNIKKDFRKKKLKVGLQKTIYKFLLSLIPSRFDVLFARRFRKLKIDNSQEYASNFQSARIQHFAGQIMKSSKSLPPSSMMALLRTWSNGWFTTHRTQAKNNGGIKLPCIFGCGDEEDSLHHYICCEPLWTLVISCTVNQTSLLHLPAANKICLVNPNSVTISLWVVSFQVYHALRNTYSHEINLAVQQSDFSHIAVIACALLINFAEELNLR